MYIVHGVLLIYAYDIKVDSFLSPLQSKPPVQTKPFARSKESQGTSPISAKRRNRARKSWESISRVPLSAKSAAEFIPPNGFSCRRRRRLAASSKPPRGTPEF